tara:strand:- start:5739 stop:6389 length:651 start_codon:yes stop_codon:yes gene_type:complete
MKSAPHPSLFFCLFLSLIAADDLTAQDGRFESTSTAASPSAAKADHFPLVMTGEIDLTSPEASSCDTLFLATYHAALENIVAKLDGVEFWTDKGDFGANSLLDGRFREFYIHQRDGKRTLWIRSTAGPDSEFPRQVTVFHVDQISGRAVVASGVYLKAGPPVWLPKHLALRDLKEEVGFWIETVFAGSANSEFTALADASVASADVRISADLTESR